MQLAQRMSQLGTETAFEVLARAEALRAQGKDVINLGIGQPDFPTPPHIVDAAAKALRDGTPRLHTSQWYCPPSRGRGSGRAEIPQRRDQSR